MEIDRDWVNDVSEKLEKVYQRLGYEWTELWGEPHIPSKVEIQDTINRLFKDFDPGVNSDCYCGGIRILLDERNKQPTIEFTLHFRKGYKDH